MISLHHSFYFHPFLMDKIIYWLVIIKFHFKSTVIPFLFSPEAWETARCFVDMLVLVVSHCVWMDDSELPAVAHCHCPIKQVLLYRLHQEGKGGQADQRFSFSILMVLIGRIILLLKWCWECLVLLIMILVTLRSAQQILLCTSCHIFYPYWWPGGLTRVTPHDITVTQVIKDWGINHRQ